MANVPMVWSGVDPVDSVSDCCSATDNFKPNAGNAAGLLRHIVLARGGNHSGFVLYWCSRSKLLALSAVSAVLFL